MPLDVICCAQYLTTTDVDWRDGDHSARQLVKAVKGEPFAGYGTIPVSRREERLDAESKHRAVGWAAEMLREQLTGYLLFTSAVGLVPIPPTECTLATPQQGAPHALARALAGTQDSSVVVDDVLAWDVVLPKAHETPGARDPQRCYDHLRLRRSASCPDLVLVDDVITSGAHMQAAKARLTEAGHRVMCGVAVGFATRTQCQEPFAVRVAKLNDWFPAVPTVPF